MHLVDDCFRPTEDDNKHNMKAGGTRRVGVYTYRIEPLFQRYDYNSPKAGKCDCENLWKGGPHMDCVIWGRGWGEGDGKRLRDNLMWGTYEVQSFGPEYVFEYVKLTSSVGEFLVAQV